MAAGVLRCTGDVAVAADGAPLCSGLWELVPVPEPFSVEQLDPAMMAAAFAAGFSILATCWLAGQLARVLLSMFRGN